MKKTVDFELIKLGQIPQVSLNSMNETHDEEVTLLNSLYGACKRNENVSTDQITNLLNEWIEHTYEHFDNENKLMEKYNFPAKSIHQHEHSIIIQQIKEFKSLWLQTLDSQHLINYMETNWLPWFSQHVATMDTATANFINMQIGSLKTI